MAMSFRAKRRNLLNRTAKLAPTNAPTVFITKSVTSKKPTCKTSWRHSMQSERPKAAKVTIPTRRQEPVRFDDASHSLENPLESDPIVVLIIDPPPSFNSSKKQKQAEVTKNHSSLLCIQVFPFS